MLSARLIDRFWPLGAALLLWAAAPADAAEQGQQQPAADKPAEAKVDPPKVDPAEALEKDVTQGALRLVGKDAAVVECPLKHTDVRAEVAGFLARVKVTQTFVNPSKEKIEAVYVFPLPHEAAVDDMTMVIGERKIVGIIKRRAEARQIYEEALRSGQTAALLEQERPNIFTQSVGNIEPGQEIRVEISYVDTLRYDQGVYEFHFPMVVGPRYNPGAPLSPAQPQPAELEGKAAPPQPDTTRVPDASKISPPVLKPGFRNGHDIALALKLHAGVPVRDLVSPNHQVDVKKLDDARAEIQLKPIDSLPNKDFVLRYAVVGDKPSMALLAHTGAYTGDARKLGEGYFLLMIQPREDERLKKSPPREIVFLVDISGSMSGPPTDKVRETMREMLKHCREIDTVQVIVFHSQAFSLFEKPVPATKANIAKALAFNEGIEGGGGTEMLKGVRLAIDQPIDKERLRVVMMLTDGYIGNEAEIIKHVGEHCGDQIRFWAVGIGSSPNMFLIDGVARQGGGMGKRLGLEDDSVALAQEAMTRIQRAQLAKLQIDWGKFAVAETHPAKLPELWAGRPVVVYGRYRDGGAGEITVRGLVEGEAVSWPVAVTLPKEEKQNDVLAKAWARQQIESLMQQSFYADSPAIEEMVTAIALDYKLMSQYTSFVAVDAKDAAKIEAPARLPQRMLVPVPLPAGTLYEGFFGEGDGEFETGELALATPTSGKLAGFGGGFRAAPGPVKQELKKVMKSSETLKRLESRTYSDATKILAAKMPARPANGRKLQEFAKSKTESDRSPATAWGRFSNRGAERLYRHVDDVEQAQNEIKDKRAAQYWRDQIQAEPQKAQEALTEWKTRSAAARAYFDDLAAMNLVGGDGEQSEQALRWLEQARAAEVAEWTKALPALAGKLDLVVRDQSLEETLRSIAAQAKFPLEIVPGSVADMAAAAPGVERVNFVDLRRATVAEALDWLLLSSSFTWRVADGGVIVGVERRMPGESAWVYDVADLALPLDKELEGLDYDKATAKVKDAAERFVAAVRKELKLKDENVKWFSPGELLVYAEPEGHARVAELITRLADPKFAPGDALKDLYEQTAKRAAARAETTAQTRDDARRARLAGAHLDFGWRLLAAAAGGELDLEALTELQIAWKHEAAAKPLADRRDVLVRSLWLVSEAAAALPREAELQTLARAAQTQSAALKAGLLEEFRKAPDDPDANIHLLYAALALRGDQELADALRAPLDPKGAQPRTRAVRLIGQILLGDRPKGADELVALLSDEGVDGETVALGALACRRAGESTWNAFRAESVKLLGERPLPGSVVALVNRLAQDRLPLAAR